MTSSAYALEALQLGKVDNREGEDMAFLVRWEAMPTEVKIKTLCEIFPSAKIVDVTYILTKSADNYDRALENLLNLAFLDTEANGSDDTKFKRGIDGFSEPYSMRRGKNKKGKKDLQRRSSSHPPPLEPRTSNGKVAPSSRWNRAKEEIEFIASRVFIPRVTVQSMYHENNASLSSSIAAICRAGDFKNIYLPAAPLSVLEEQAAKIAKEFPNLKPTQTLALVQMTYPSTTSAIELANALSSSAPELTRDEIIPHYRPRPPSPKTTSTLSSPPTMTFPSHTSESLADTRSTAYRQAAASYRLSKSKPLMSGAAAYYSSVARDANTALRRREAIEADALVSNQSRPGELDLHGVNIRDGVSIAARRVELWWEADGRETAREGKVQGAGLRIITGKGQHSEGGKGRLGPVIGAMLVRDGWKIEVGQGFIDVVGRTRR